MSDVPVAHPLTSRRAFLRGGALAAVALPSAATVLASCVQTPAAAATKAPVVTVPAAKTPRERADEMDAMHEQGIKAFPAKTAGKGNQLMQPRMDGSVKVYDLTAAVTDWEVEPGKIVHAWTYNGQVPGPQIRVREGDRVRVNLINNLPESTIIHFHGLEVPNDQDGVPFITQPPVKPGAKFTYEFTVPNSGSHMYHSHHNSTKQVGMGLLGAFIVEPRDTSREPKVDVDYVMILNDSMSGYTLNGKGFPATEPVVAKRGQTVRIRFMNEGMMIHPMHLHGMHMTVIAKDGWPRAGPVEVRHPQYCPRRSLGRPDSCQQPGNLGVSLPYPRPRRVGARDVRDGDRAGRAPEGKESMKTVVKVCSECPSPVAVAGARGYLYAVVAMSIRAWIGQPAVPTMAITQEREMRITGWLVRSALLVGAVAALGCTSSEIVYRDRPPFNAAVDSGSGLLGYYTASTKQTTCGNCHAGHQQDWSQTHHSHAFSDLSQAGTPPLPATAVIPSPPMAMDSPHRPAGISRRTVPIRTYSARAVTDRARNTCRFRTIVPIGRSPA